MSVLTAIIDTRAGGRVKPKYQEAQFRGEKNKLFFTYNGANSIVYILYT